MLAGMFLLGCHIYVSSEAVSDTVTTSPLGNKKWGAYFCNINIQYMKWLEFIAVGTQYESLILADIYSILERRKFAFFANMMTFHKSEFFPSF